MNLGKKRIVVWGTGEMVEGLINCFEPTLAEIVCFVDSNAERHTDVFLGKRVIVPEELVDIGYDFVFVSTIRYQEEILEQLKKMGVDRNKVISAIPANAEMAKIVGFITEKGMLYFSYLQNGKTAQTVSLMADKINNRFKHLFLKQHYEAEAAKFIAEVFIDGPNAPGKQVLFEKRRDYFDYVLENLTYRDGLYLEFGVWKGGSINYFSDRIGENIIYGFDSFEGLPDEWVPGCGKGSFSVGGSLPKVNSNVRLIKGWFDETLPQFVSEHKGEKCSFIHIDSDVYSSAKCVFTLLKDNIGSGTTICFDELVGQIGWQNDEYKAFMEFIEETGYKYKYLAGSFSEHPYRLGERVAIEIL